MTLVEDRTDVRAGPAHVRATLAPENRATTSGTVGRPGTIGSLAVEMPERRPAADGPARPRHLRPIERKRRRRSPAVPVLVAVGIVIVALLALALMHALLIGGQLRLDGLRRDVEVEAEEVRVLELRVAELEAPGRVLDAARARLGMVEPPVVGYFLQGSSSDSGALMRVTAAVPAPAGVDTPTPSAGAAEKARPSGTPTDSSGTAQGDPESEDPEVVAPSPTSEADAESLPIDEAEAEPALADQRPDEGGRDE